MSIIILGMAVALLTDHYELTMIEAALQDGTASKRAVFEAYFRSPANSHDGFDGLTAIPEFGLMAGSERIIDAISRFAFTQPQIAYLEGRGFLSRRTLDWLETYRFGGDVIISVDGDTIHPGVPVLTVKGDFAESIILETLVLSILNSEATIATKAMQFRLAAGADATLIEMGSRRTHEEHAVDAAHAAIIGGFDSTSNLEAGFRYDVPTGGTAAHAWTLAHGGPEGEAAAFRAQIEALGVGTTLLVDTFDIPSGIRLAVEVAREFGSAGPGAIRIDSGDLGVEARRARDLLDSLGAQQTRIVVSGDLDIVKVAHLHHSGAPVDAYGVGTQLVAAQPLGFIYKLVEIENARGQMIPVAKNSATPGKATVGGAKTVLIAEDGTKVVVGDGVEIRPTRIRSGHVVTEPSVAEPSVVEPNVVGRFRHSENAPDLVVAKFQEGASDD